jgi:predicted phosphoribosyltransferase
MALFKDRIDAGRVLAEQLGKYAGRDDVIVLHCREAECPLPMR